jgi:flagellar basal-body rod modification protein FlgD
MTVPSIDVAQMGAIAQPARTPKQTMDSEVFMHLLVTQLSNQDPSSPMDTNEMIGQSTQLASMERLNALSATQNAALDVQQRTAAAALVGREAATDGADPISGVVTAVSFAGGEPMVTIGELQVPYSHIVSIRQATAVPASGQDPQAHAEPTARST